MIGITEMIVIAVLFILVTMFGKKYVFKMLRESKEIKDEFKKVMSEKKEEAEPNTKPKEIK